MNSRRNTIINLAIILITCVVIIICITTGFSRNNNNLHPEPETASCSETVSISVSVNEELPSETSTELITIPEPSTPEDKTFSSDEEIYNYAVSQINQKKYYSAIKYLRKIPTYKDAQSLMSKAYRQIQGDYFTYSHQWGIIACPEMNAATISSDIVLKRSDWTLTKGTIVQCRSDGFIDSFGTFHLITPSGLEGFYKPYYDPLLEYNKKVPFKYLLGGETAATDSFILTTDNRIVNYHYNSDTQKGTFSNCNIDALSKNEKAVYMSSREVLTNEGYVYVLTQENNLWKLVKNDSLKNVVSINEGLYIYENGTVSYADSAIYPVITSWSDIISAEVGNSFIYSFLSYCCGITSDGSILVAVEGSRTNMQPFDPNKTYVSVECNGDIIAALTDTGDVCTFDMTEYLRRYPSTDNSAETETTVTIPDNNSDLTFSSEEAIYNYAVNQLNSRKYYAALRYLQKIPNYKDSTKLQYDAYRHIHQDYFASIHALTYDNAYAKVTACEGMNSDTLSSANVISLTDMVNFKGTVDHYFDNGFVDTKGNIYLTKLASQQPTKDKLTYLNEYNQKVKLKQVTYDLLLTLDNKVIYQGGYYDHDPFTTNKDFIELNTDSLSLDEKIVFLDGFYAFSNYGNVYECNTSNYKLQKRDELKNVISFHSDGEINFYLTNLGTVICNSSKAYSAVNTWTDIISIEIVDYGCIGLKADGTIVTAAKDGSNKDYFFPKDIKFNTIVSHAFESIAAISDNGQLYIFTP